MLCPYGCLPVLALKMTLVTVKCDILPEETAGNRAIAGRCCRIGTTWPFGCRPQCHRGGWPRNGGAAPPTGAWRDPDFDSDARVYALMRKPCRNSASPSTNPTSRRDRKSVV